MILILEIAFGFILWSNIWSTLENVQWALEWIVYAGVVGWGSQQMVVRSGCSGVFCVLVDLLSGD